MPYNPTTAVCLLSGGLDSSVLLAYMLRLGYQVHALSVDYLQRNILELDAARAQARLHQVPHTVVVCDLGSFAASALTDHDTDVPTGAAADAPGIPATYVPARNSVLLSIAASYAETVGASVIGIGVNAVDYGGYPDCRSDYIAAMQLALNLGTRAGREQGTLIVHTPLIGRSKADIIRMGAELGVPFSRTISCYQPDRNRPGGVACGECSACRIRAAGFAEAGLSDALTPGATQ